MRMRQSMRIHAYTSLKPRVTLLSAVILLLLPPLLWDLSGLTRVPRLLGGGSFELARHLDDVGDCQGKDFPEQLFMKLL